VVTYGRVRNSLPGSRELWVFCLEVVDPLLHLGSETSDESLHGPGSCVSQSTDRVTFNLVGKLLEHVDLCEVCVSNLHSLEHVDHPAGSLSAGGALSTALVSVELGESQDGIDDVGLVVHHDDGGGTESASSVLEVVKVHEGLVALLLGQHRHRGATGNDSFEVVPAADDALAMSLDELSERNAHLLLDSDGVVDVPADTEQLGTCVSLPTEAGEPARAPPHDGGADCHGLNVGDSCGTSVQASVSWEGGLESRSTRLALERLDKG